MSLRLKVYLALAGAALVVTVGAWLLGQRIAAAPRLMVENTASGEVLLNQPVAPGARLTLSYLHSVSRTRVVGVLVPASWSAPAMASTRFEKRAGVMRRSVLYKDRKGYLVIQELGEMNSEAFRAANRKGDGYIRRSGS